PGARPSRTAHGAQVLEGELKLAARIDRRGPDVAQFTVVVAGHEKARGFPAGAVQQEAAHLAPGVEHGARRLHHLRCLQGGELLVQPAALRRGRAGQAPRPPIRQRVWRDARQLSQPLRELVWGYARQLSQLLRELVWGYARQLSQLLREL